LPLLPHTGLITAGQLFITGHTHRGEPSTPISHVAWCSHAVSLQASAQKTEIYKCYNTEKVFDDKGDDKGDDNDDANGNWNGVMKQQLCLTTGLFSLLKYAQWLSQEKQGRAWLSIAVEYRG
jgi:hypothetical protein